MSNWLSDLVNQHAELESPKSFWFWAGLASISATVKDNVWMNQQIYNLYPNIYVMLHADSGMKKGPPVAMAKKLVGQVNNTRIIGGRSSIQGILKEMGTAQTHEGTGAINNKSVAFICSSELTSSIVEDKVATSILTDLYDRQYNPGGWKSLLKMESFELKDPTVTMLTATNEAMSNDFFTRAAIQGGYFARTFIVFEKETQNINSLIYPLANPPNYTTSAQYLKKLSKLNGAFHSLAKLEKTEEFRFKKTKEDGRGTKRDVYFSNVGLIYEEWYESFRIQVKQQEVKDDTGTLNRFGDSVLKVAMLLSLAEHDELIITEMAMQNAISECEKLIGNARRTTLGKQGMSATSQLKTSIIFELLGREDHRISRAVLMKKMWMNYSTPEEFDEIMNSFQHAKMIDIQSIGNQIIYVMPDNQVQEFKKLLAGKNR